MGLGSIIGGVLGGVVGGVATKSGQGISAGYAVGSGIGGGVDAIAKKRKAEQMTIDESSPTQTSLLQDIQQRRKSMEAGYFYMPQQQQLMQLGMGGMRKAASVTGGSPSATISALNMLNRSTGRNLNELYGGMQQQAGAMIPQEIGMGNQLYNQRYSLQSYAKLQELTDATQKQKDAGSNISGFMADPNNTQFLLDLLKKWSSGGKGGGSGKDTGGETMAGDLDNLT